MIKYLLVKEPANRLSAEELLKRYQHKAFIQSLGSMLDPRNEFEFKSGRLCMLSAVIHD